MGRGLFFVHEGRQTDPPLGRAEEVEIELIGVKAMFDIGAQVGHQPEEALVHFNHQLRFHRVQNPAGYLFAPL
jgi:hypothetical protein